MKKYIKFLSLFCAFVLLVTVFAGCKEEEEESEIWQSQFAVDENYDPSKYDLESEPENLPTTENLVENTNYILGWNDELKSVTLVTKADGRRWGTNPVDRGDVPVDLAGGEFINSALTVRFSMNSTPTDIYSGSSVMNVGRVGSEQIDNGISVTYYFDEYYFSITVDYYLEGDSVKISMDPQKIVEASDYKVVSVGVAPFMCSAKNTADGSRDSYIVLPSGSGALMYTDQRTDGAARSFSAPVYGQDKTQDTYGDYDNDAKISMPFFGVKEGNSGTMGIIEQGAEYCTLRAQAGDANIGYSSVYAWADVRGQDVVYLSGIWRNKYSDELNQVDPLVIGFYGLSGDQANYVGMAKRYQKYLIENEGLKKTGSNKLLNAKILGYYMEDDLFLGLPIKKAQALTTYEEAQQILTELKDVTGGSLSATMYGYGEGGVNGTKVAGNYKLTGVVGNRGDLENFLSFTSSSQIEAFFNFDVINFSKSGGGISKGSGAALNNTGITAYTRQYWKSTRAILEGTDGGVTGMLVGRSKIETVVNKTVEETEKLGISNIAFNTLGNSVYSDYRDDKYPSRAGMASDVQKYIQSVQQKNNKVMVDSAFSYAAAQADVLTGCPISSNQDRSIDVDVPLYQIVFQGYKENYVTPINYVANRRTGFLKAIETGSGLSFILMNNYDIELRKQYDDLFGASLYSDNKSAIAEYIEEGGDFLKSVASAEITNHHIISENVTRTDFSNGKAVYVNTSDTAVTTDIGSIAAMSFKVV